MSREERDAERVRRRNDLVPSAAWELAKAGGLKAVTRRKVAQAIGMSVGTVNNACGTMDALRNQVLQRAVEEGNLDLLAQGIAAQNPIALGAPADLKAKALATLI